MTHSIGLTDSIISVQHHDERNDAGRCYTALVQQWKGEATQPGQILVDAEDLPALATLILEAIAEWALPSIQADSVTHEGQTYFLSLCRVEDGGDRFTVTHEDGRFAVMKAELTAEVHAMLNRHCNR